jgi:hypothetical protein
MMQLSMLIQNIVSVNLLASHTAQVHLNYYKSIFKSLMLQILVQADNTQIGPFHVQRCDKVYRLSPNS